MLKDMSIEDSTQNVEIFDYHYYYGWPYDHPRCIPLFQAATGYTESRPGTDVYYHSEGICKYGAWNRIGILFFLLVLFAANDQLYCPD